MKLNYLALFLLLLPAGHCLGQAIDTANTPIWIEMMQDPDANFFETQKAFEVYWESRERHKGDGWKVFKRWENLWAGKVNEDGSKPAPDATYDAYEIAQIAFNQTLEGPESVNGAWEEVGPIAKPNNGTGQPNGNGRLNTICFHPTNANAFWVGAPAGGLWKTTDGGATWSSNTDALATLGVSSMLVDPSNTNVMYIGTGDRDAGDAPGLGVFKSTDGGNTWFQSNSGMGNKTVGAMLMHPSNSSYLLAATSGGVYRSQNSGSTWTLESNSANFKDLKYKPGDPNTVYATETSSGAGFHKSTDGGNTWNEITTGLATNPQRYVIGVSQDDPTVVYVLCSVGSAFGGLYKSTNSGTSFSVQSTTPNILGYAENGSTSGGQGWYDLTMEVDPNNEAIVYVGGVNIWKSVNSGSSWDCAAHWVGSGTAASVHADQHWFSYSPLNGRLYACNDGGIYYTDDGGQTWPELSSGLGIGQIYKIGVSQNTHELVINGYQDNGTAIWDNSIFRTERGGDGMECAIDHSEDAVMYASVYYGNITRSLNNGVNFSGFAANGTNGITEEGAWVTPYILGQDDPNIMFIGYKNIWRTTNAKSASVSFDQISNNLGGTNSSNMRQLRQSKVNSNRLFAIRSNNTFFRSDNALSTNPSWTDLTSNLPGSGTLRDVETDPFNNNTLWISRGNDIWKSTNGGSSWVNIDGVLPNIAKHTLCADPYSNGGLYVGATAGVYYIDNSLANWIPFNVDLPVNVSVEELEIYHPDGNWVGSRIRAATYGRGLWESDLYDPGTLNPMVFIGLSLETTDICSSDTIQLFNNTAYGVSTSNWTITPATGVSYVNGTNSSSMNPQIVVSNLGNYDVKLVVTNGNGSDSLTLNNAITVSGGLPFPWEDDFELNDPCSTGGCATACEINSWVNVTNGVGDDVNWRVDVGGTPSGGTGPSVDYDPGTDSTNYIYIEATSCFNQLAILESPCLSVNEVSNPEFSFAYHMYGNSGSFHDLELDVLSNGTWSNLWTQAATNLGDQWNTQSVSLNNFIGQSIKVRFVGETGSAYQSDVAIDGIEFTASPAVKFTASDTTPCIGGTVQFNDQSSQNPTNWQWVIVPNSITYMNGTTSQSQNPKIRFDQAGFYTITLICSNQYGSGSATKTAYIESLVAQATLLSQSPTNSFCPEDTVSLSIGEPATSYSFYFNGSLSQVGSSNISSYPSWNNGDQVYAVVVDSNGCQGTSDTMTLQKFSVDSETLLSSDEDNTICDGDSVEFSVTSSAISTYEFVMNGSSVQNGSSSTWSTSSLVTGDQVWSNFIDTNGCMGATDTITSMVLPIPAVPSIQIILDSLECSVLADIYMWEVDSTIDPNTNRRIAKQGDGFYRVRIAQDGCWSEWSEPLIITGIENKPNTWLKVYPSPANQNINIELVNGTLNDHAIVKMFDIQGALVFEKEINNTGSMPLLVSLEHLASGTYTVVLSMEGKNYALPIIKE